MAWLIRHSSGFWKPDSNLSFVQIRHLAPELNAVPRNTPFYSIWNICMKEVVSALF